MSEQIMFFRKSLMDLSVDNVTITVTDAVATNNGQDYVDYMRNRKNDSAWLTTGSTDAANTELEIDFTDSIEITDILLVGHNLKAYTIEYWTGVAWADFSTAIAETVNAETTNHYNFTSQITSKIKLIITGAQVVDADKVIKQLIVSRRIGTGQLTGWPTIKKPMVSTNKKSSKMLSGKINLVESVDSFSCELEVKSWNIENDLDIIEEIYFKHQGVLLWLSGGDEDQFSDNRKGYRLEDIYLVRPTSEYTPELHKGVYSAGIKTKLKLKEAVS